MSYPIFSLVGSVYFYLLPEDMATHFWNHYIFVSCSSVETSLRRGWWLSYNPEVIDEAHCFGSSVGPGLLETSHHSIF